MARRKEGGSARRQDLDKLVVPRTFQIKVKVELWELSAVLQQRHQSALAPMSVAAAQSADSLATANLPRRLRVRVPVKESVDDLACANLQPPPLPVQVQAKREDQKREGKVPMLDLPGSPEAEGQLRLSKGRGNRSAERKRARGLPRRDHNYLANFRGGSGARFRGPLLLGCSL
jgi:hypothetical protein